MSSYPRPTQPVLFVEREPVGGECPECGASDLRRYPVLTEGGWFQVVKCRTCLHSVYFTRVPVWKTPSEYDLPLPHQRWRRLG